MIELLQTRYGPMYIPDTDNGQYWWLKTMGASPEDEQIEMICALLDERPRGAAIDCGANFGCWTLPLARHCSSVHAFEPQRCIFDILKRTIDASGYRNFIQPYNLALGPESGTIKVPDIDVETATNFGGVSLGIPHSEQPNAPMYEVRVVALDQIFEPRMGRISFIKADVEGAELGLLRGAERTIRRWKPILIVEADHPLTDTIALGSYIESLGYNVEIAQDNNFIGMPL